MDYSTLRQMLVSSKSFLIYWVFQKTSSDHFLAYWWYTFLLIFLEKKKINKLTIELEKSLNEKCRLTSWKRIK